MITNLVAIVTVFLTTNVSEVFPTHLESMGGDYPGDLVAHMKTVPDDNPTTKQVITAVTRHTAYQFYNGVCFEETSNCSSSTQYFKLHTEWVVDTNPPQYFLFQQWKSQGEWTGIISNYVAWNHVVETIDTNGAISCATNIPWAQYTNNPIIYNALRTVFNTKYLEKWRN